MKESKIFIISVIIVVIITIIGVLFIKNKNSPEYGFAMPWNSFVINNTVNVLGINLMESTIFDMLKILGADMKIAFFKDKNSNNKQLEIYYDSAKIGGLNVRIIGQINLSQETLKLLNNNIKDYETMPSGNEKVTFNQNIIPQLINLKINNITITPKTNLSQEIILERFGEPDIKNKEFWQYYNKGLKIIMDDGLKILEYSNQYII